MGQVLCGTQPKEDNPHVDLTKNIAKVECTLMRMEFHDDDVLELVDKLIEQKMTTTGFWGKSYTAVGHNSKLIDNITNFAARERSIIDLSILKVLRRRHHDYMLYTNPSTSRTRIRQLVEWTIRVCIRYKVPAGVRQILIDKVTVDYFSIK